ncbi:restriction endonuclease subunit S [Streptomyces sp. RKCA744]|uniref:restriction endonuclease subunit S n=1 Tax=Streptomyces sp. RKCA744 TaxID=2959340 RepID=UPI0020A05615|nr:restriction endonuclease subunit S [Streptomyces sp. RKCA744]MCO8308730.1 restriction endonuclease subunit S [Streptomyces sp. RKCA744]
MSIVRLRHLAEVNPLTPAFDRLANEEELTFLPMEAVWPGERLDISRRRTKASVATGYTRFQDGDVLVPKITPTFEAGRSVLIRGLHRGVGTGSTELHVLRPGPLVDPRFLLYVVNTHSFLKQGEAEMYGVAGQQRVPDAFLRDLPVQLPSLEEQHRIADFLDAETLRIDTLAQIAQQGKKLLNERRWATVHAAVTGLGSSEGKKDRGLGWTESLPERWPVVPLKWIATLGSGHTPSRSRPEYWENCSIPWISLFDVGRMRDARQEQLNETVQQISKLGMANSSACLHPAGTVVLSRTASVGFSTVMGLDMAVSQHFVTWTCGESLSPYYLLHTLRAMRQYFESVQVGTTNVTVFMPDLNAIKVPLPPLNEQELIVQSIRAQTARIDALAENFDRQVRLLAERRQALITAAVTGQIDVSTASGRGIEE